MNLIKWIMRHVLSGMESGHQDTVSTLVQEEAPINK